MKFFTHKWWDDGALDASVFTRYAAHFASIRERLPLALVELHERHTLRDARVQQIHTLFKVQGVEMTLEGWDVTHKHHVTYQLSFTGVSRFNQYTPMGKGHLLMTDCDIGYWECYLHDEGVEMHVLFESGSEFIIVFKQFELIATRDGDVGMPR